MTDIELLKQNLAHLTETRDKLRAGTMRATETQSDGTVVDVTQEQIAEYENLIDGAQEMLSMAEQL